MTLLKRQDGYLNQRVILFRLKYETHSLRIHPKPLCRYVVALTTKLSERRYALRLAVVLCQYFPSTSPLFQPISPSPLYHISSVAVPHLLHRRINPYFPASLPPCSSAAVFTADLIYHPHYPGAMIWTQVGSRYLSIFFSSSPSFQPIFFHLCRPTFHLLSSHISFAAIFIR